MDIRQFSGINSILNMSLRLVSIHIVYGETLFPFILCNENYKKFN